METCQTCGTRSDTEQCPGCGARLRQATSPTGSVPYGHGPGGAPAYGGQYGAPYGAPYGHGPGGAPAYGVPYGAPYGPYGVTAYGAPYPGSTVYEHDPGSGFSITAIVLGLVGLLVLPIVMGPVAVGFAIAAMVKHQRMRVVALCIAIVCPIIGAVLGMIVLSVLQRYR